MDFYDFQFKNAVDASKADYPDGMFIPINSAIVSINMADKERAG
jgi:hypothetical protein